MITLTTADNALKTIYLGVIGNQLNVGANPLLTKIKQTTNNVYGNEVRKATSYGMSGGVTAGTEDGALPGAYSKGYEQFVATLKNLYGTIEITDKAIRSSQNSAGAFVNLLNEEMESLIKSSTFNLGRMLYGDGSGIIASVSGDADKGQAEIQFDSVKNMMERLACRFVGLSGDYVTDSPYVISAIDRSKKTVKFDRVIDRDYANMQLATLNGLNNEITGLGKIISTTGTLYGIDRANNAWMNPYIKTGVGSLTETAMQSVIDSIDENSGGEVDFIACSSAVRRAYQEELSTYKRNVDVMNLQGGFKALSFNGIPVVADRFVADDTMYMLNTKDFELCQLCDWQWLEDNEGRVIRQKEGYPVYTATLVKYAELLCNRPNSQAKLTGITGA